MGVGDAEDAPALDGGEGAQADPVGQVALQLVHAALVQALGGQQQVHAQAAAQAADHDEQVHEVAVRGEQFAELVDHHEQRGHRFQGARRRVVGLLVLVDVGEVARRAQVLLAADEFAVQRVLHALHERGLLGEVGDQRRGVLEPVQADEGGAALEVHEDEVERLRGVGEREREDERAQQFALARAGRADQHAVRAHAAQGGLLQVQFQGRPVGRHPDGDAQPVLGPQFVPVLGDAVLVQVGDAEQGGQLEVGGEGFGDLGGHTDAVGREQAGQARGAFQGQRVGAAQRGGDVASAVILGEDLQQVGVDPQGQGVGLVFGRERVEHVDDDGVAVASAGEARPDGDLAAVDDDDGERLLPVRGGRRVEPGAVGQVVADEPLQFHRVRRHEPHRPGAVALAGVLGVRQPLEPGPVGVPLVRHAGRDPQLVVRVEDGQLADDRPDHRPARRGVAPQRDARVAAQVDGDGLVPDRGVGPDEAAQGVRAQRFQVLDGFGGQRGDGHPHGLLADRQPHLGEVVVGDPALPQPGGPHDRPQGLGCGRTPQHGVALLGDDLTQPNSALFEIAQVIAPFSAQFLAALDNGAQVLPAEHDNRADEHHATGDVGHDRGRSTGAGPDEQHQHGHRRHRHRQVHEHRGDAGLHLGQFRRLLETQLPRRHVGARPSRGSAYEDRAQGVVSSCGPAGLLVRKGKNM